MAKRVTKYNQEIEVAMQLHYSQLNQKDKRHYAAVEAMKLGYGGQKYISDLLGISPYCIRVGIIEISHPEILAEIPVGKQRRPGGGRKKKN